LAKASSNGGVYSNTVDLNSILNQGQFFYLKETAAKYYQIPQILQKSQYGQRLEKTNHQERLRMNARVPRQLWYEN